MTILPDREHNFSYLNLLLRNHLDSFSEKSQIVDLLKCKYFKNQTHRNNFDIWMYIQGNFNPEKYKKNLRIFFTQDVSVITITVAVIMTSLPSVDAQQYKRRSLFILHYFD